MIVEEQHCKGKSEMVGGWGLILHLFAQPLPKPLYVWWRSKYNCSFYQMYVVWHVVCVLVISHTLSLYRLGRVM